MFEGVFGGDKDVAEEGLPDSDVGMVGEEGAEVVDLSEAREAVLKEGGGVEDSDFEADTLEAAQEEGRREAA